MLIQAERPGASRSEVTAAGVMHDLRNMLAVANSGARLLRAPMDASRRDGIVSAVQQALLCAERLTAALTRPGSAPGPNRRWIDVGALLARQSALYAGSLPDNILLRVATHSSLPMVWFDQAALEAALLNLVLNARDAMPGGGVLTIRTKKLADRIRLMVADTGMGMDGETLSRIGTPFFTLKADRGTGLGLAQVRRFARDVDGRLWVRSRPGRGTVFLLDLPC